MVTAAQPARASRTATVAHYLLVGSIVLLVLSPLTYRTGLLDLGVALQVFFPAGVLAALLAILVGIAGIITTRSASGRGKALTAFVGGIVVAGIVGLMVGPSMLSGAPAIHDITTDMDDPPVFVSLRHARDARQLLF